MSVKTLLVLLCLKLAAGAAFGQMRRRGGDGGTMTRPGANPKAGPDVLGAAVASFDGTLRGVVKGKMMLEISEDKVLTLIVNKKTEVLDGDRHVKLTEVAAGTLVTAEAHKVLGELVAIKVKLRGRDPHAGPEPELKHRN